MTSSIRRLACRLGVGLGLAVLATSCHQAPTAPSTGPGGGSLAAPSPTAPSWRAALHRAERQWASRGPADYDFTVRITCFCFGLRSVRFAVRDGVSTALDVDAASAQSFASLSRVDLLFADAHRRLDREPFRFGAEFDGALGYPTFYFSDGSEGIADDESGVSVSDFVAR